jgi:hypothetical protein
VCWLAPSISDLIHVEFVGSEIDGPDVKCRPTELVYWLPVVHSISDSIHVEFVGSEIDGPDVKCRPTELVCWLVHDLILVEFVGSEIDGPDVKCLWRTNYIRSIRGELEYYLHIEI